MFLKQETVSGSGISWAIGKAAPRSRQITMPAPNHSVFYRPDGILIIININVSSITTEHSEIAGQLSAETVEYRPLYSN